jgi:hypothetical protein
VHCRTLFKLACCGQTEAVIEQHHHAHRGFRATYFANGLEQAINSQLEIFELQVGDRKAAIVEHGDRYGHEV